MKDAVVRLPELRAQIARAGVSRAELARRAGVSYPTMHRMIHGAPIELATLGRVTHALNECLRENDCGVVQLGDLIKWEGEDTRAYG